MASLNAKVLKRVDSIKAGDVGASEAACDDLGSCRMAKVAISAEENVATDASAGDAVVDVAYSGVRGTCSVTLEDITKENVADALGGTVSGSGVIVSGSMEPVYKTLYIRGAYMDGTAALWHVKKAYCKPGAEVGLSNEQMLLEAEWTLMADSNGELFEMQPISDDTTAPTFTCVPADAATGVAADANIVFTANEAIRTEDVTAGNFFVMKADGTVVAGALSIGTSNTVVTFNPSSNLSTGASYIAVANAGVRDTAGNPTASQTVFNFTVA